MSSELPQAGQSNAAPSAAGSPAGSARPPTSITRRFDKSSGPGARPRDPKLLARLFESLPPHAIEAEMSLLGSILIDPQVIGDVIFIIKRGEEFYKPAHGVIFDAMV